MPVIGPTVWALSQVVSVVLRVKSPSGIRKTLAATFDAPTQDVGTGLWSVQVRHALARGELTESGKWEGKVYLEGTFPEGTGEVPSFTFTFTVEKEFLHGARIGRGGIGSEREGGRCVRALERWDDRGLRRLKAGWPRHGDHDPEQAHNDDLRVPRVRKCGRGRGNRQRDHCRHRYRGGRNRRCSDVGAAQVLGRHRPDGHHGRSQRRDSV